VNGRHNARMGHAFAWTDQQWDLGTHLVDFLHGTLEEPAVRVAGSVSPPMERDALNATAGWTGKASWNSSSPVNLPGQTSGVPRTTRAIQTLCMRAMEARGRVSAHARCRVLEQQASAGATAVLP
jgi:hypothetical protein